MTSLTTTDEERVEAVAGDLSRWAQHWPQDRGTVLWFALREVELTAAGRDLIPADEAPGNPLDSIIFDPLGIDWRGSVDELRSGIIGQALDELEEAGGSATEFLALLRHELGHYLADEYRAQGGLVVDGYDPRKP